MHGHKLQTLINQAPECCGGDDETLLQGSIFRGFWLLTDSAPKFDSKFYLCFRSDGQIFGQIRVPNNSDWEELSATFK